MEYQSSVVSMHTLIKILVGAIVVLVVAFIILAVITQWSGTSVSFMEGFFGWLKGMTGSAPEAAGGGG